MIPQPRHVEAATRCINDATASTTIRCNPPNTMTAIRDAIADAENKAAWDVKRNQPSESTYEWMEAKYGPRPADAAMEVGNE